MTQRGLMKISQQIVFRITGSYDVYKITEVSNGKVQTEFMDG